MIVPLWVVAFAFTVATTVCVMDMIAARVVSVKAFRVFEGAILGIAANYYWQAYLYNKVPSADLRIVWIALCIVLVAEIISRQSWGTKTK